MPRVAGSSSSVIPAPATRPQFTSALPGWLRAQHFLNLFFLLFIIRAGVQILADHPRLYWTRHCTPGKRVAAHAEAGAGRSAVDREAGLDLAAEARRAAGAAPLDRARALVAPRHRRALARERRRVLRAAVRDAANGAASCRRAGRCSPTPASVAAPVPVARLAGRQQLGRVQRAADHRLLHHRVRRGAARARDRARHVARAVDAVQARQQAAQHPGRAVAALPRAVLVSVLHRRPRRRWCSRPACCATSNHIYAGTDAGDWAGFCAVRGVDGGRRDRLVRGDAVHAAASALGAARRLRADRAGAAAVRARRREAGRVQRAATSRRTSGTTASIPTRPSTARSSTASSPTTGCGSAGSSRTRSSFRSPQLRALPHHEQITQHFCIQGWSGIAKWGGVSMQTILDLVKPTAGGEVGRVLFARRRPRQGPVLRRAPDRADALRADDAGVRHERRSR